VTVARLIPVALLALLSAACTPKEVPYGEEIAAWRAEKDAYMRSARSPVPPGKRGAFPPLEYFPIDESYRVPAELKVVPSDEIIEMDTSDGNKRRMRRIGRLAFTLKGRPQTLTAFADASENDMARLFVPFGDLTSGTETYPGGRYLDLDRTATGLYDLDFNRAYHPFCVYNPEYVCPIPPRENRLTVPIRAGEKL
jgi:uncharacterized protein (DUF1684 family)